MKTVSIIIPVYNVAKYLPQCLDSVINQTYSNLQIIVVDDGSTDNSGKICDEYAEKDNRITVIHQKNAGAANAKNTGLDNVDGDYVTFADSDDWVELNWIDAMVSAMEKYDVDVVECSFDRVFVDSVGEGKVYQDGERLTAEEYFKQYNENWVSVIFWNKLYKATLTKDIRFRKERRCIDDEFYTYKVVSNAEKMARISDVLYHYRQRKTSAVNNKSHLLQITNDSLDVLIERYEWIKSYNNSLKKNQLINDINALYYYSRNKIFNDALIKKHKRIARYYLRQCLTCFTDRVTFYYAIRSVFLSTKKYNKSLSQKKQRDDKKHFE